MFLKYWNICIHGSSRVYCFFLLSVLCYKGVGLLYGDELDYYVAKLTLFFWKGEGLVCAMVSVSLLC